LEFPPRQSGEYCSDAGRDLIRSFISRLRRSGPVG
jgi:hypothetical protein